MEEEQTKHKNGSIIALLLMMYLIVAMGDNFKGIFAPYFKQEFHVDDTQIGLVMTASLFAYAVFQYVGGSLIGRLGYKKVTIFGFVMAIVAAIVIATCVNFPMLVFGMFLLNIGMAMFNISVCTLGPALSVVSTALLMNMINFSYGAGTTVLQRVSGALLLRGVSWRAFFIFMVVATAALLVYLLFVKIPYQPVRTTDQTDKNRVFKNHMLYLYVIVVGCYLASEYGVGNWFVSYMHGSFDLNSDQSAVYISIFFGAKTIGLLLGGFIVERVGLFRSILTYGSLATVLAFIGVGMGQSGLLVFALSGFFFSAIFPTLITTIKGRFKEDTSYVTGLILMMGTLIAMAVSLSIGVLSDWIGSRYAFFMIPVTLLVTTLGSQAIPAAQKRTAAETSTRSIEYADVQTA